MRLIAKTTLTMLFIAATAVVARAQNIVADSPQPGLQILSRKWVDRSTSRLLPQFSTDSGPLAFPKDPGPATVVRVNRFVFEMNLANTGARDVREIGWDYTSIDPETQQEITSYHFYHPFKISAHKERTLSIPFPFLPAGVASLNGVAYERVAINCVVYSDKSLWRRDSYVGDCKPPKLPLRH